MTDTIVNKKTGLEVTGRVLEKSSETTSFWFQFEGTSMSYFFKAAEWRIRRVLELPTKPGAVVAPVDVNDWANLCVFTLTSPDDVYPWAADFYGYAFTPEEVNQTITESGIEYHVVFAGIGSDDE